MSKNDPPQDTGPAEGSQEEGSPLDKLPPPPPFQPDRELITYIEKGRKPGGENRSA